MKKAYTEQDRIRIVAMLSKGKAVNEISKATKISPQTIRTWGRAANEEKKKVEAMFKASHLKLAPHDSPLKPVISLNEVTALKAENELLRDKIKELKEEKVVMYRIIKGDI